MRKLSGMKSKKQLATEKEAARKQEEAKRRVAEEAAQAKAAAAEAEESSMSMAFPVYDPKAILRGRRQSDGASRTWVPGFGFREDNPESGCSLDYDDVFILDPVTGKSDEPVVPPACASTTGEGLALMFPDPNPLTDAELLKIVSALVRVLKIERIRANSNMRGRVPRCDAVLRGSSIAYLSTILLGVPELRQELFEIGGESIPPIVRGEERSDGRVHLQLSSSLALPCSALLCSGALWCALVCSAVLWCALVCSAVLYCALV